MCTQVVEMQENICQKNDMTFFLMPSILRNFKVHFFSILHSVLKKKLLYTLISLINVEVGIYVKGVQKLPNH